MTIDIKAKRFVDKLEKYQFEEILESEIKPSGDSGHFIVPKKYIGKKAFMIIF